MAMFSEHPLKSIGYTLLSSEDRFPVEVERNLGEDPPQKFMFRFKSSFSDLRLRFF